MNKKYDQYTDEELIRIYREGDEDAIEYLLLKHRSIVAAKASNYFLKGGERDDLLQIGMIGLMRAVWNYKEDRDASFVTFANTCVDRALISAVDRGNSNKNGPLNDFVTLFREVDDGAIEERAVIQSLGVKNPEEIFLAKENATIFLNELESILSASEKEVFHLFLQEMDYKEIAEVLGKTPKSVDNTMTRIKNKAKTILKEVGTKIG